MTDFFFQMGLSNACLSLALAIVAMVVGAKARRPHLAHLLWLLVFVKLVTPPIVTIPVLTIPTALGVLCFPDKASRNHVTVQL
jgi:bla regulator protein BlaR1